ncbi:MULTISPECIES: nucleotidyltransferase domain-containing protein [Mycobacteroides]|uniref:nucleotidyltransferase domain-containing protein n=1 Tax=Mycobacteroides TaxID=670516 RepID=UPI00092B1298|nr:MULTISPECIES: nucleotidyltransferase domain-containing protein [Mycobacteroides]MBF9350688.1 hypothetical protein [Mycobacteroides chelonae]SIL91520.1 Predicted nucleotidyltransferase [Mycobacteroides abscessus subsp. abscessus]SLC37941.1 Predicted nucleotidyltransferase [Mycobacteroides abscessus subsp. abscessus]
MVVIQPVIVGEIGSVAHGLGTPESDHDYMGIYIDAPEVLIGWQPEHGAVRDRDKPEGIKSEAGDSETTYYGLRKYVKLITDGNPTVMTLLFTPNLTTPDRIGLQANRDMFLSRKLATRHVGYADSMHARLTGKKAPRTNRPELIAKHGYDTKAAFHALRLLIQGYEMLTRQTMTMPMTDLARDYLLNVRHGKIPENDVLDAIEYWRAELQAAEGTSPLPPEPDYTKINQWLIETHVNAWPLPIGVAA